MRHEQEMAMVTVIKPITRRLWHGIPATAVISLYEGQRASLKAYLLVRQASHLAVFAIQEEPIGGHDVCGVLGAVQHLQTQKKKNVTSRYNQQGQKEVFVQQAREGGR